MVQMAAPGFLIQDILGRLLKYPEEAAFVGRPRSTGCKKNLERVISHGRRKNATFLLYKLLRKASNHPAVAFHVSSPVKSRLEKGPIKFILALYESR